MASKRNFSEAKTLEIYSVTLRNAKKSAEISKYMDSVGYDSEKIAIGDALLAKTRKARRSSINMQIDVKAKYKAFSNLRESINDSFKIHRKTAKVAFRRDNEMVEQLALNQDIPKAYSKWLKLIKKFYSEIAKNNKIQEKLSELNLEAEAISAQKKMIREMEKLRADYLLVKAESLKATNSKDEAFDELYEWMKDFYTMAKIAMRKVPKLMIAFGKGPAMTR